MSQYLIKMGTAHSKCYAHVMSYQKCGILEPSSTYHWTAFIDIQANNGDIQLSFHELSTAERSTYIPT